MITVEIHQTLTNQTKMHEFEDKDSLLVWLESWEKQDESWDDYNDAESYVDQIFAVFSRNDDYTVVSVNKDRYALCWPGAGVDEDQIFYSQEAAQEELTEEIERLIDEAIDAADFCPAEFNSDWCSCHSGAPCVGEGFEEEEVYRDFIREKYKDSAAAEKITVVKWDYDNDQWDEI